MKSSIPVFSPFSHRFRTRSVTDNTFKHLKLLLFWTHLFFLAQLQASMVASVDQLLFRFCTLPPTSTKSQDGWCWKVVWRLSGPTPLLNHGHTETVAQDHIQTASEYLQEYLPLQWKSSSWCSEGPSHFVPLVLAQGTTENRLAPSSLQVFIDNHEILPEPPLLLAKQSQLSQPLPLQMCCSPFVIFVVLRLALSSMSMSLLYW